MEDRPPDSGEPWERLDAETRYRIKSLVGRGGMATVHKAFDRALRRNVALKTMKLEKMSSDHDYLSRFIEEAQITSQMEHPGIVSVFDAGRIKDGRPFFTMRLVSGRTLEDVLDDAACEGSTWTRFRLLKIFLKVCETLAFAHAKGVIHRDLKPSNIMIGEYGEVTVMDWGISKILPSDEAERERKLPSPDDETQGPDVTSVRTVRALTTQYGQTIGTPAYMSPEQAKGRLDDIDERTDLYSLGVILYEILTGGLPFDEEAYNTGSHLDREPAPPGAADPTIPKELSRICMRCLAPQIGRRYASVKELIRDLDAYLDRELSFEKRRCPRDETILTKGDEAHEAYLILDGRAEVYDIVEGKKIVYATLGKGDTFGEIAVFTGERRNAHVKALTDLELLVFDREKVRMELNKVQPWMGDMISSLAEKLARLNVKYADIQVDRPGEA